MASAPPPPLPRQLLKRAIEDFNKAKYTDWSQREDIKAELLGAHTNIVGLATAPA